MKMRFGIVLAIMAMHMSPAVGDTLNNATVAWRICEQHAKMIGKPSPGVPARMVFAEGYGICEELQKLIPTMRFEVLDPNKTITDHMLIRKGIEDPTGAPK